MKNNTKQAINNPKHTKKNENNKSSTFVNDL